MMDPVERDEMRTLDDLVAKFLRDAGEHADSIQVFACKKIRGGTSRVANGSGCFYQRMGVIREWLIRNDELARHEARKRADEDDAE